MTESTMGAAQQSSTPNGAVLSSTLAGLFRPLAVAASELWGVCDPRHLLPDELQCVPHARLKRLQDFAAGRACARRALAEYGFEGFPVRMTSDRLPAWPAGFVGSITHTAGYCGAVVTSARTVRSIGIDTEIVEQVSADLWPRICTARELCRVNALCSGSAVRAAALLFSAKEAWYKCQYPLSRKLFEFRQVTIEWDDLEAGCGQLRVFPEPTAEPGRQAPVPLSGRFCFHGNYVSAGVACHG
jgi:4'-phosphopantetheinyl transferase EntD